MSILIPWNRIAGLTIRPQLFSGDQEGSLGGASLPIPRLGDRFAVDVTTTQLRQDAESRHLIARLFQASTLDARISLNAPNAGSSLGARGAVVDGVNQSGSTLKVRGMTPRTALLYGNFFHIAHAGSLYLYMVAAQVIADGLGSATVPIWPMLRFLTTDGDPCEFENPMIAGKLTGFDKGASFSRNSTSPIQFSISERA